MPFEVRTLAEWEAAGLPGMLSIVIPAHNEEGHIAATVQGLAETLQRADICYEIVVINDNSSDATERILASLSLVFRLPALDPSHHRQDRRGANHSDLELSRATHARVR